MPLEFLAATVASYLANVMSDAWLEIYRSWSGKDSFPPPSLHREDVERAIRGSIQHLKPELIVEDGDPGDLEAVTRFLMSRELENLAADAAAIGILQISASMRPVVEQNIDSLLRVYGMSASAAQIAAPRIAATLEKIAAEGLGPHQIGQTTRHFGDTSTSANAERHAALSHLRDRLTMRLNEQLAVIHRLVDVDRIDLPRLHRDVGLLRAAVAQVHSNITPPSLGTVKRVPIESIYVAPVLQIQMEQTVLKRFRDNSGYIREISQTSTQVETFDLSSRLTSLLTHQKRLVVLGNPGAGKTTLVSHIAKQLNEQESDGRNTPAVMPVVLREHSGETLTPSGIDIVEAVRTTAQNRYQVTLTRAEISFLCASGRLTLIVDGLDELLDVQDRVSVAASLEAFAVTYGRCPVIVTSRVVGYSQAPLPAKLFTKSTIMPFTETQVRTYCEKWFTLHDELNDFHRDALVRSFMDESRTVADLRENPLLLSLLCGLYRHQRYLPRNRPQVYASCSRLLFDTWDRARRLRPAFEFDAHVDGAVQHLAHWIFMDQQRHAGVPEPDLVEIAADYLDESQYANRPKAIRAARVLIGYCKDRAWILTDTGSMPSGVALFQFTHRTFLEYFTAVHLARTLSETHIEDLVAEKCKDAAWSVICQILLQLSPQKRQGLEDRIIARICAKMPSMAPPQRELALSVCVEALGSLPLKPRTTTQVTTKALDQYLARLRRAPLSGPLSANAITGRDQFWVNSSRLAVENYRTSGEVVRKLLNPPPRSDDSRSSTDPRALPMTAHLFDYFYREESTPQDMHGAFTDASRRATTRALAEKSLPWLDCIAVISMFPRPDAPVEQMLGDQFPAVLGPLAVPWGCQGVPNVLEGAVWVTQHYPDEALGETLRSLLERAMRAIASADSPMNFIPTRTWHQRRSDRSRVGGAIAGPQTADIPLPLAATATRAAFLLTELYTQGHTNGQFGKVSELLSRDWGALHAVPAGIEMRYGIGDSPSDESKEALERMKLSAWCSGVSALHL